MADRQLTIKLPLKEAVALRDAAIASGRETYTDEGIRVFNAVQKLERAINNAH